MGGIIESIKNYTTCFFLGVLFGGVCVLIAVRGGDSRALPASQITTTTVSGAPQNVSNVHTKNGALTWTTTANGAGVSVTSVPLKLIPEANSWLTKRHTVLAKGYYLWTPDGFYPGGGVDYQYRVERLVFSAGVILSQKYAGVCGGLGIVF